MGDVSPCNGKCLIWAARGVNPNGPDGNPDAKLNTNISAFGGISGLQDTASYFYLVGVFLHGKQPASPPATLNFTDLHSFEQLAPLKGQVFFVGDGLTGTGSGSVQHFKVPLGATDLYLGFADAPYALGPCGAYSDNFGSVSAVVRILDPADKLKRMSRPVWNLGDGPELLSYAATSFSYRSRGVCTRRRLFVRVRHAGPRCRWPLTRRNCFFASTMPAAHQRNAISRPASASRCASGPADLDHRLDGVGRAQGAGQGRWHTEPGHGEGLGEPFTQAGGAPGCERSMRLARASSAPWAASASGLA